MRKRHPLTLVMLFALAVLAVLIPTSYAMKTWQKTVQISSTTPAPSIILQAQKRQDDVPLIDSVHYKKLFQEWVALEPTAGQMQKVMIQYADLHPGKINRWQTQSRLRALIPSLSFGADSSRGNNIDLDRGSTSQPDEYIFGPDETDEGWDVDLRWDLGDLIWSTDQNAIEYRKKQLNDQRHYILSEGMHLYFERRRLQMEMWTNPASTPKDHYEKLLRIDEFTALLDVFTGGYLSQKLEEIYHQQPHLKALWEYPGKVLTPENIQATLPPLR